MTDYALAILDRNWTRLALTSGVVSCDIEEELGSAENRAIVVVPADDDVASYVPNPDDQDAPSRNFEVHEDGVLIFAGLIDKTTRTIDENGNLSFGGIQRGGELAGRNFGRRDVLGWPLPEAFEELLRDNIGRAPFATVTASSEDDAHSALNAITGEPQQGQFWSVPYTGTLPETFAASQTLTIDLGAAKTIEAVRVLPEWWSNKWYKWRLKTGLNEFSYTTQYDKSDGLPTGDRGVLVELGGISARYVHLEVYASSDGYPRIAGVFTYEQLAEVGSDTTYAVPWIENDDSGNITVNSGTTTRVPLAGAFPDVPLRKGRPPFAGVSALPEATTITHRFRGTSTSAYFSQPEAATVEIFLDDVSQGEFDIPEDAMQYKAFEVTDLANDAHELKIVAIDGTPMIDYFSGEYESSWRRIQEDDPSLGYYGPWQTQYSDNQYHQSYRVNSVNNSQVAFSFYGDSVKYIGAKSDRRGIYEFYIDGVSQGLVDAYSATPLERQVLFEWSGSYGGHRLVARNTGSKNPSSSIAAIDIDQIEGNWAHNVYLRSANDTNLSLIGRLSEMTNSFMRLNYDGTVDLLGTLGTDSGQIIREGENEGGSIEEADVEGDFSNTASAILALGRGSDNQALRVFVQDRDAVERMGIKVAKIENRDAVDPYLLARQAWQTLQDAKMPKRHYRASWIADEKDANGILKVAPVSVGEKARLWSPRLGLTSGDRYRLLRRNTSITADGKQYSGEFANKRDRLSDLLTRASRDLSVTTDTPQGFKNVTQYGGNAENFVAEASGSTFRSAELDFHIDDDALILDAKLRMKIGLYRSYERDTTSGGGSTSGAGGGQTSSTTATPSGGGSTSGEGDHRHIIGGHLGAAAGHTNRNWQGNGLQFDLPTSVVPGDNRWWTYMENESGTEHTHTTPNHTHPAHSHTVSDHTHTTPDHTHSQTYDIFEEGSLPGAVSVLVDGVNVDSVIGGPFSATADSDTFDVSLTGVITQPGWHTIRFEADSGKGRITPYVIVKSLQLQ